MHSRQTYDNIKTYLCSQRSQLSDNKAEQCADFSSALKPQQRAFRRSKDEKLSELNVKYIHPQYMHGFSQTLRKPVLFKKPDDGDHVVSTGKKSKAKKSEAVAEATSISHKERAVKDHDGQQNQNETRIEDGDKCQIPDKVKEEEPQLTFKERIKALDDKKKKAFMNYKWWEHSLTNSKNVNFSEVHQLLMQHDEEYRYCCISKAGLQLE